jgi:hypothetical protein
VNSLHKGDDDDDDKDWEHWYEYILKLVETGRESEVQYIGIDK